MPTDILPYSSEPEDPANRRYTIMLVVLALLSGFGILAFLALPLIPTASPRPPHDLAVLKWVAWYSAAFYTLLITLVIATLILRSISRSNACLIWTKAFNIFLLIVFPWGTIVGVYGLWKVDKAERAPAE